MAIPVLILGQSGTGKSYSMKKFNEDEICLISVQKTLLPFRKKFNETVVSDSYIKIAEAMSNEFMRRATERGYDKFIEIAFNFWDLIVQKINELPADTIVYILCHISTDENGVEKMKTIGKLVDEKITPEGLFTIVLKTTVSDGKYAFITQNNGRDTVKSPEGMFSSYAINNDLKYVDDKIRNYYYMDGAATDEEIVKADEEAKREEVQKPEPKAKRRRAKETDELKPLRQRKHREDVAEASANVIDPDVPVGDTTEDGTPRELLDNVVVTEEAPKRRRRRSTEEE